MIVIDRPLDYGAGLNSALGKSSHLCSTLPGDAGRVELVTFAKSIGMREAWLQKPGTRHEHFDVFGRRYERAIAAGASEVTRQEIVAVWKAKGAAMEEARARMTEEELMADASFVARVENLCVVLDRASRARHSYDQHASTIRVALASRDAKELHFALRNACRAIEGHNNPSSALREVHRQTYSLRYEIDEAYRQGLSREGGGDR